MADTDNAITTRFKHDTDFFARTTGVCNRFNGPNATDLEAVGGLLNVNVLTNQSLYNGELRTFRIYKKLRDAPKTMRCLVFQGSSVEKTFKRTELTWIFDLSIIG